MLKIERQKQSKAKREAKEEQKKISQKNAQKKASKKMPNKKILIYEVLIKKNRNIRK